MFPLYRPFATIGNDFVYSQLCRIFEDSVERPFCDDAQVEKESIQKVTLDMNTEQRWIRVKALGTASSASITLYLTIIQHTHYSKSVI